MTERKRRPRRFWPAVSRLLRAAAPTPLQATLIALLTAPALAVFGDVVAGALPARAKYVLTVLVPTLIVLVVLMQVFDQRRPQPPAPGPLLMPWSQQRLALFGRAAQLRHADRLAAAGGAIGIVGPRDAGTSAVARQVVRNLPASPDPDTGEASRYRLDLRGRSSSEPEQARVVAVRLLTGFGLDPPADGSVEQLRDAAKRLRDALGGRTVVLLLDEAFRPEQVRWLVSEVDHHSRLTVVVAGERAVADAFDGHRLVPVGPLGEKPATRLLRHLLDAEPRRPKMRRLSLRWFSMRGRDRREPSSEELLTVVRACRCLPGVIVDVADELRREGSEWTLAEFAVEMAAVTDVEQPYQNSPAVRVWTKIFTKMLPSLSRDAEELMAALAGLGVTELPRSALAKLLPDGADGALDELWSRYLVRQVPPDRFRMPEEVRLAVRYGMPQDRVTRAAAAATAHLVTHYAGLAGSETERLRGPATAADAAAWFTAEERLLVALLGEAVKPAETPPPEQELERIAGALEAWYVRIGDHVGLAELAQTTMPPPGRSGRPDQEALARLRRATAYRMANRLDDAERELAEVDRALSRLPPNSSRAWRSGPAASWQGIEARRHNGRVLLQLALLPPGGEPDAAARDRLAEAEGGLQECQRLLPQADQAGEVSVLVNLGAVRLALGDPAGAEAHLTYAVERADSAGDGSGRAHAVELLGIAAWQTGAVTEALGQWEAAALAFDELGETVAASRCRGHHRARAG